jgi:hypothetical protein
MCNGSTTNADHPQRQCSNKPVNDTVVADIVPLVAATKPSKSNAELDYAQAVHSDIWLSTAAML